MRIACYRKEVESEPWKQDHEDAMDCISFQSTLEFGIGLYDFLVRIDERVRDEMLKNKASRDAKVLQIIRRLFGEWLVPCEAVNARLVDLEKKGFDVEHAAAFRKRHAEAIWMLKPASKAFADDKFVEARDEAIDALRAGKLS